MTGINFIWRQGGVEVRSVLGGREESRRSPRNINMIGVTAWSFVRGCVSDGRCMEAMKIALFHMGFMYSGGGERLAIQEALCLEELGHHVECFAPAVRRDLCHPGLIDKIHIKSFLPKVRFPIPLRDFTSLAASSFLAPLRSRQFRNFDAILCHGQPATWIGYTIARSLKKNYLCYLHQPARFIYPREIDVKMGWATKRDFALLNRVVCLTKPLVSSFDHVSVVTAKRVLTNSRWIGDWIKQIYGVSPLVCPPGVDLDTFKPVGARSDVNLGHVKAERPYVLSTNRHYPQKGMEYLIQLIPRVLSKIDANFVVTGDRTSHTRQLVRLANELGVRDHVIFTGLIKEDRLVQLYQNAEAYAYTSPQEDFGLGPIEAMACGTPPIVWDCAGPAETVTHEQTGLKVQPYSVNGMADEVIRILTDKNLRQDIARQGRIFVTNNFSWANHINILSSALEKLPSEG